MAPLVGHRKKIVKSPTWLAAVSPFNAPLLSFPTHRACGAPALPCPIIDPGGRELPPTGMGNERPSLPCNSADPLPRTLHPSHRYAWPCYHRAVNTAKRIAVFTHKQLHCFSPGARRAILEMNPQERGGETFPSVLTPFLRRGPQERKL
jgi:hypothetical protein